MTKKPLTVLIVENDNDRRELYCDVVRGAGFLARSASSTSEALRLLLDSDILILS